MIVIKKTYRFISDRLFAFISALNGFFCFKKNLRFKRVLFRPILSDNTSYTSFDRHYIFHPAWAARIIAATKPKLHIDISSTLYFCSIISAFVKVNFFDYRPVQLRLNNLNSGHIDLTNIHLKSDSINSLSCMHTIEHIGLGRYGDPINPDSDLVAISELKRVLAKDGNLLFVVPIGNKPILVFNAHRIYTKEQIIDYFKPLHLIEFTLIPESGDDGDLIKNPSKKILLKQRYACGCFWFKKI